MTTSENMEIQELVCARCGNQEQVIGNFSNLRCEFCQAVGTFRLITEDDNLSNIKHQHHIF